MNAKNRKIAIILVIALILAAVSAVAIYAYLVPQKVTVYVFNGSYSLGTTVTSDMLTPVQVDKNLIVSGANQRTNTVLMTKKEKEELIDKIPNTLRISVEKGMPLTESMLSTNHGTPIELEMDKEKVAVTIPIDSIKGVANELRTGSRVNIYVSGSSKYGSETYIMFENMRVIAVDKSDGSLKAVTFEVTPAESVKLIDAVNKYAIYLGLVNGAGYQAIGEENE